MSTRAAYRAPFALGLLAAACGGTPPPRESAARASHARSTNACGIDASAWREAPPGSELTLRWIVHKETLTPRAESAADPFSESVPVDLLLTLAGRTQRIALVGNAAGPAMVRCDPGMSALSFYFAGMSLDFTLERAAPTRMVLVRRDAFGDSGDGAGGDRRELCAFDVPVDVAVRQRIVVRERGDETDLCRD